jgi:hypothetical protein
MGAKNRSGRCRKIKREGLLKSHLMKSAKQLNSFLIIVFLICLIFFSKAQSQNATDEMVGFGCYFAGHPTLAVVRMTKLIEEEQYVRIASHLESKNEALKYLAVITIEKLVQLGKYKLTEKDKNLIADARKSHKKISVCSGCTYFDKVSMKTMLSDESFIGSKFWLEELFNKK